MASNTGKTTFYGWRVVAVAFVLAMFGWGFGFYGPPIFLEAVQTATGWSLSFVSAVVTLHFLIGAAVVANLPRLHALYGLPAVTGVGTTLLAMGVCGWAAAAAPWQLLAAAVASGVGWGTMGGAAVNAFVSPWFVRDRPAALSMAYNGASVGGVVFSPLWVAAIAAFGFTAAAAAIGVIVVAVTWLLAVNVLSRTPEAMGLAPDGAAAPTRNGPSQNGPSASSASSGSPWRNPQFLTLAAGMAIGLFAQIGLIAHMFSLLVPGLGSQQAGLAMALATAAAIGGRTLVGWLMPPGADRRLVACASYVVQIAGAAAFIAAAGRSVPLLYLGVILFGAGIGNATSLPPLIAQSEFARGDVPRVVALIVAISQAAYAFAPAVFGVVREWAAAPGFDAAGADSPLVFIAAAALQTLAIASFAIGRRKTATV